MEAAEEEEEDNTVNITKMSSIFGDIQRAREHTVNEVVELGKASSIFASFRV